MNITIVFVTHNRLEYTKKAIERLLADSTEQFDLYLWDNASTDGTREYLKEAVKDPRIVEVVLSKENVGQTGAMNYVWSKTRAELVGKLDNDCLVTPGWIRIFANAHKDVPQLGAIAMWNFSREDFDYVRAEKKICTFEDHKVFRHPWICGSGFIMKRKTFLEVGPWNRGPNTGTTSYFLQIALKGYINGWYYPLVLQEHMDDPKSKHSMFHRCSFQDAYENSYGFKFKQIYEMDKYIEVREQILRNLMNDPYDPRYYVGWRAKAKHSLLKIRRLLNLLRR